MLGTPLGAMCLCAPCALSIHFSLSFSEKECSSVLPQCSSCMLFFVRRICCCSSESLKHLCSCSKFSSCCWLSPPWILGFGLFDSVRVLSQGRPSWCHQHVEAPNRGTAELLSSPKVQVGQGSLYFLCFLEAGQSGPAVLGRQRIWSHALVKPRTFPQLLLALGDFLVLRGNWQPETLIRKETVMRMGSTAWCSLWMRISILGRRKVLWCCSARMGSRKAERKRKVFQEWASADRYVVYFM